MLKIGIVFSGSLSKGAFHLGFIRALTEKINTNQIKALSGTSSGAIIAYAMATDQLDVLEDLWENTKCSNPFSLWIKIVFGRLLKKYSKILIKENDEVKIPFYVTTFRFFPWFKFKYVKFEGVFEKKWRKVIEGSLGFPIVTGMPVFYKYGLYVDGGVVDNVPYNPLLNKDLDIIFVLHFDNKFNIDVSDHDDKIIINLVLSTYSNLKLKSFNYSTEYIRLMRNKGYEYSVEVINRLMKHKTLEGVRHEANLIVEEEYEIRKNINSLDTIPTKSNRLFRKRRNKENNIIHIKDF